LDIFSFEHGIAEPKAPVQSKALGILGATRGACVRVVVDGPHAQQEKGSS